MRNSVRRQTRKVGVAGGFINQMMGNNITLPEVGKGATILMYSDRHPYEVIETNEDASSCVIREMDYKFIGSGYGDERYEYFSNPEGSTMTIEWNEKKQAWGQVTYNVEIIKALAKKLQKEYGWGWSDYLPVPYKTLIDGEPMGVNTRLKLVEGVTKEYRNFYPVSIIFGFADKYRDPSF